MRSAVYVPLVADGYELCHPLQPEDFERFNVELNGAPRRSTWTPVRVQLIHEDEDRALLASDCPWLGSHALIFRQAAVEKLGSLLARNGELLPLNCPEADLVVLNPTHVLDALDQEASSVIRFSGGRIMRITRYAFRKDAIEGVDIFKIPDLRVSPTFVSEHFVQSWASAKLHGLVFNKVWPS